MAEALEHEIEHLRAAFWSERDPDGRAFAPLADAYRQKGELPRALDIVQEGTARLPEFASGHLVAGRVHLSMDSAVEAEMCFRRVLELDTENTLALRAMGDLAKSRGGHAEAAEYFRRLSTLDPNSSEDDVSVEDAVAQLAEDSVESEADEVSTDPLTTEGMALEDVSLDEVWEVPEAQDASGLGDSRDPIIDGDEESLELGAEETFNFHVTDLDVSTWDQALTQEALESGPDLSDADAAGLDPLNLDVGEAGSAEAGTLDSAGVDADAMEELSTLTGSLEGVELDVDGLDAEDDSEKDVDTVESVDTGGVPEPHRDEAGDEDFVIEPIGEFLVGEASRVSDAEEDISKIYDGEVAEDDLAGDDLADEDLALSSGPTVTEAFKGILGYRPKERTSSQEGTGQASTNPEDLGPKDWTWTPVDDVAAEDAVAAAGSEGGVGQPVVSVEDLAPDPIDIQQLAPDELPPVAIQDLAPSDSSSEVAPPNGGGGREEEEAVGPGDFQAWLDRHRL